MQWRLQINRLQELIDQLECKVSAVRLPPCGGGTVWNPHKAGSHRGPGHALHPSQAPRLEPLHEEELTKGPSSVSLGGAGSWCGAGRRP